MENVRGPHTLRTRPAADAVAPGAEGHPPIAVLLVSDAPLLRDGLVQVLATARSLTVVGAAGAGSDAVAAATSLSPAVTLLDMSTAQCVEIGRAIRAAAPSTAIVAFSLDLSDDDQLLCVEAGITGFVPRNGGVRELVDAVERVARGDAVCSPHAVAATFRRLEQLSARRDSPADVASQPLSDRELEVVELIDGGLSNKEIARRLSIGVATVKNHVHHILEKLHVSRRGEAAARLRSDAAMRPSLAPPRLRREEQTSARDSRI